jgi:hypothetical protein
MAQFPGWAQMHFHLMLGSLQCRKEMCAVGRRPFEAQSARAADLELTDPAAFILWLLRLKGTADGECTQRGFLQCRCTGAHECLSSRGSQECRLLNAATRCHAALRGQGRLYFGPGVCQCSSTSA